MNQQSFVAWCEASGYRITWDNNGVWVTLAPILSIMSYPGSSHQLRLVSFLPTSLQLTTSELGRAALYGRRILEQAFGGVWSVFETFAGGEPSTRVLYFMRLPDLRALEARLLTLPTTGVKPLGTSSDRVFGDSILDTRTPMVPYRVLQGRLNTPYFKNEKAPCRFWIPSMKREQFRGNGRSEIPRRALNDICSYVLKYARKSTPTGEDREKNAAL